MQPPHLFVVSEVYRKSMAPRCHRTQDLWFPMFLTSTAKSTKALWALATYWSNCRGALWHEWCQLQDVHYSKWRG